MSTKEQIIYVLGDSFAGHRSNADWNRDPNMNKPWSWVNLLESELCHTMLGKSFGGQSFWHQRRQLFRDLFPIPGDMVTNSGMLKNNEPNTILIICHTETHRLPVRSKNLSVTGHILNADKHDPHSNEIYNFDPSGSLFDLVKTFYLSELFVYDFYDNAFYTWLNELPALTKNFKKVIHFFGFKNGMDTLPNRVSRFYLDKLLAPNAVIVKTLLLSLHQAERGNKSTWGGPDVGDDRANHFNLHNNRQMFEEIKHIIENVPGGDYHEINLANWDLKNELFVELLKPHRLDFDPNNDPLA